MDQPLLSFVIPTYNDAPGLARHLAYFKTAPRPVELIIVDDCSSDGLETLIKNTTLPDHVSLRFHRNSENRGPGTARNTGLDMVTGEYVMFLDADDLLTDSFFTYLKLFPLSSGADFILFKYHLCPSLDTPLSYSMHINDNLFFSSFERCSFPNRLFRLDQIPSVLRLVNFPWTKLYRTAFLKEAGICFPDLRMHEDIQPHWASFLRARHFGILHWAPPLIHHVETANAARATNYTGLDRLQAFQTMQEVYAEILQHPLRDLLRPELMKFSADLLNWMIHMAPPDLRQTFQAAGTAFHAAIDYRPEAAEAASRMGQVRG